MNPPARRYLESLAAAGVRRIPRGKPPVTAAMPVRSFVQQFRSEFQEHVDSKTCTVAHAQAHD